MKKIQVMLSEVVAKDVAMIIKNEGFESESDFGRHAISEWITLRKYGILKQLSVDGRFKAPGGILTFDPKISMPDGVMGKSP